MVFGATVLALAASLWGAGDEELSVWDAREGLPQPAQMLSKYLAEQAQASLARRRERLEQLQTPEECRAYQQRLREFFLQQIGGLPEPTPLNAQVAGRLEGDDYRVEKIIYESRPNHRVTAALYLPRGEGPFPAVLVACGHSKNGKAAGYNQRMSILLAKHGLAAMCYDPIGQGERSQILNEQGQGTLGSTTEHFLTGVGAILAGTNTAQYRIYDGIRGIDYLASREDIDGQRIGFTGCSGGGTLTSYIMCLDDRVLCAAPACYVTTFERLIDTIGPQDAEQNIYGQLAFGMDHPDYVLMRAPKPTLIVATTDDYFDIRGSWDSFRQAKRFYARLGHPERVDLVEDAGKHGVTPLNRQTLTHWMRRWLLEIDAPVAEPEFPLWTDEQLQCTPQGQVLLLPGERSVFELNAELAQRLAAGRLDQQQMPPEQRRAAIRQLSGVRPLGEIPRPAVRELGKLQREGYTIEKLLFEAEPGLLLPALAFVPQQPSGQAYLYLHEDGKAADAGQGGPIAALVADGHVVLSVDLPGLGQTRSGSGDRGQLGDWKNFYLAYLNSRSLAGLRAENVLSTARWLAEYGAADQPRQIHLIASGEAGVAALHAAGLEPQQFRSVLLRRTLISWEDVVRTPQAKNQLVNTVHGALAVYDLPDLVRLAQDLVRSEEPLQLADNP